MDSRGEGSEANCYYSLLGIRRNASASEIRSAYRKQALKWHPDRWTKKDPSVAGEAKRRFQQIQEAYSVLSDNGKRSLYDVGLFDPLQDDDEGFTDFMEEMLSMMDRVRNEKEDSLEDLQKMFAEMVEGGAMDFGPSDAPKRTRVGSSQERTAKRGTSCANMNGLGTGVFC